MRKVVVIDMDGTLVDVSKIQPFLKTKPRNWDAFHAGIPFCPPIQQTLDYIKSLVHDCRLWVVGTASMETQSDKTEANLRNFGLTGHYAPFKMYHRPANDFRKDDIIKVEMVARMRQDGIEPTL